METLSKIKQITVEGSGNKRRDFLKKGIILGALTGITGVGLMVACKEKEEEEVTPSEDLMREHGVFNRILLVYDACRLRILNN